MNKPIKQALSIHAFFLILLPSLFAQEVTTKEGTLRGVVENEVEVFKGVPFAAPPVGELRWRAPRPPEPWSGVRAADTFSPICMQVGMYPEEAPIEPMSEDCLYLNIWRPQQAAKKLPVMVWFYGGGLLNGSASTPLYGGEHLAKQDVIVVTVNYRLGAFGFLAHPKLSGEADYKASGNYGLLDMIAALRWIQESIALFGGDPNNVTVFGQSSGAISISALTTSPLTRGLFHKAIAQSGGLFEPIELDAGFSLAGAEQAGERFATRAGAHSIRELRKIPADELVKIPMYPSVNIDGYVLVQSPFNAYEARADHGVALLIGNTIEEGREFISDLKITKESYQEELGRHFPGWLVSLAAPDPGKTDEEAMKAAISFEGDMRFRWDMWTWGRLATKRQDRKVFVYQFAKTPPFLETSPRVGWGAAHGSELAYVFGQLEKTTGDWSEADTALSKAMVKYWTNFAKQGNPNSEGLPTWPAFSDDCPRALFLDREIKASMLETAGTLSVLDRVYATVRFVMKYYILLALAPVLLLSWVVFRWVRRFRRIRYH